MKTDLQAFTCSPQGTLFFPLTIAFVYLTVAALLVVGYGSRKLTARETIPGTEHTGTVPSNPAQFFRGEV